jgi:hypothetical protein
LTVLHSSHSKKIQPLDKFIVLSLIKPVRLYHSSNLVAQRINEKSMQPKKPGDNPQPQNQAVAFDSPRNNSIKKEQSPKNVLQHSQKIV